jgi:enterochelin esterase-like enzyme
METKQHRKHTFLGSWGSLLCAALLTGCLSPVTPSITTATATSPHPASKATSFPTPSATQTFTSTPTYVAQTPLATAANLSNPNPTTTRLSCLDENGRYDTGEIESDLLRQPLAYRVYLPPCYDAEPTRRYPTLYLIHGQSYTDEQWDQLGADETLEALLRSGEIVPFLIVMPRDRTWEQPTEDMFGEVVMSQLLPAIDRQYRTLPDRQYRAVGGLSRGAGWALHLGLSHWEYFGAIGAHSLPVFHTDASKIPTWLDQIPFDSLPRIYLDIGDKDRPSILQSAIWFEKLLASKNIPHEWYLFSGYHEETYWQVHMEQYLHWYAQEW